MQEFLQFLRKFDKKNDFHLFFLVFPCFPCFSALGASFFLVFPFVFPCFSLFSLFFLIFGTGVRTASGPPAFQVLPGSLPPYNRPSPGRQQPAAACLVTAGCKRGNCQAVPGRLEARRQSGRGLFEEFTKIDNSDNHRKKQQDHRGVGY